MSKLLFTGALAVTAALAAHPAVEAGEHQRKQVAIGGDEHFLWASGNVGDVYNSRSGIETIWCQLRGVNYVHGICFARDDKGTTLQCNTMLEPTIRPMLAIGGDSTIFFLVDRKGATCTAVHVTNGSYAAPKRPPVPETDDSALDTTGLDEVAP